MILTREKEIKKEINKFFAGWDWKRIFQTWKQQIEKKSVTLEPFFTEIDVYDPGISTGREPQFAWFPSDRIREQQLELQHHFERFPGTNGYYSPYSMPRGEFVTLNYLWENRKDIEKIAAILISASLFSYVESSRPKYYEREKRPPRYCVKAVYRFVLKEWIKYEKTPEYPWHYSCTNLLPQPDIEYLYRVDELKISSLSDLIKRLADDHAEMLREYKPVVIVFTSRRNPFVEKMIAEEEARERELRAKQEMEQQKKQQEQQERKEKRLKKEQLKKEHSCWKKWSVDAKELERLVWSMPTVEVAKLFNVSDVAVAKRCKSLGIHKPTVGFWAKVKVGKIPHPQGVPVKSKNNQ